MKNILLKSKIGKKFLIENSVSKNNIYELKNNNNNLYYFLNDYYKIKNKRVNNKFNALIHSKSYVYNYNYKNNNYFNNDNINITGLKIRSFSTSTLKIKNLKKNNYEEIFKNKYVIKKKNNLVLNKYSYESILKINETYKKLDFLKNSLNFLFPKIYNIRLKEKNKIISRNDNLYNNYKSHI